MKKYCFILVLGLCLFLFSSCELFLSTYTAINDSSYTVEFSLDGDYKTLDAGKQFTEKRYNNAKVELLNDVPVTVNSGYNSVTFKDLTTIEYEVYVKNILSETVILKIGNIEKEIASGNEINFKTTSISPISVQLKKEPNYEISYTKNFVESIYYILIY